MKRSEMVTKIALDLENAGVNPGFYNYYTLASRIIQIVEKYGMKPPLAVIDMRVVTQTNNADGSLKEEVSIEKMEDYLWEKEEER